MSEQDYPCLPIVDLLEMEMNTEIQTKELINNIRRFLNVVHKAISARYDESNYVAVNQRLTMLANILPSASMAKAIAIKAFHKKKLVIQLEYINDPDKKKLGMTAIKDLAKDHCYAEIGLMSLADETHADIREQIGALRSILSAHKAELEARIGGNQT